MRKENNNLVLEEAEIHSFQYLLDFCAKGEGYMNDVEYESFDILRNGLKYLQEEERKHIVVVSGDDIPF